MKGPWMNAWDFTQQVFWTDANRRAQAESVQGKRVFLRVGYEVSDEDDEGEYISGVYFMDEDGDESGVLGYERVRWHDAE